MTESDFARKFREWTGNPPLSWQTRLFDEHFAKGNGLLPSVIDLPTGLGKTMVMAIWLIARQVNEALPRRLIYVVDRRTVVDQATDLAIKLQEAVGKERLAVSAIRGQLADNREWTRDPSKLAIIIGTVDLIGSGLLFSGYRSGFKTRPLHAGLLGQDSLLVLDEAHLSKPFEKLVTSIVQFQTTPVTSSKSRKREGADSRALSMKVIRMSATSGNLQDESAFKLDDDPASETFDLWSKTDENGKETNPIKQRFEAKKRLTITTKDDVIDSIATTAGKLVTSHPGSRIVIFVKSPKDVDAVRKSLIKKDKSCENKIAMLTGTMRGLERDELVDVEKPIRDDQHERRVMQRFLKPDNEPTQGECFLISTSAGEVGFDLNADHMACDAAPLDSMIQRLGRVNRRGNGEATIHLILAKEPKDKSDMDKACIAASKLFVNDMDLSPMALKEFTSTVSSDQIKAATTPEPTMVDLTDILLDAWSMTSIIEPVPGRPEVAPWLRGIDDELPQTTIAWRVELELPGFDQLELEEIEDWFATHRVLTHETLSVPTSTAAKWFTDRWSRLTEAQQSDLGPRALVVDRAGLKLIAVKDLIDQLSRRIGDNTAAIRNADLILPASFGGIERGKGLLDADAPTVPQDEGKKPYNEQIKAQDDRRDAPDVADVRGRFRQLVTRTEDGDPVPKTIGSGTKPPKHSKLVIDLESDDCQRVQLVSYVPKQEKPEWGSKKQSLSEHVGLVRNRLDDILKRFSLPESINRAGQLAADFHDHGKNRERWQRTVDGKVTPPGESWCDETLGKSGGEMKREPRGYRHEFGSLREFIDSHKDVTFTDSTGKDITREVFDLAMHLIAVHHGRGRPHFPKGGFDPDAESRSPVIHIESIRRFARLQRQYGHWRLAWLENLLRCADALASDNAEESNEEARSGFAAAGGRR